MNRLLHLKRWVIPAAMLASFVACESQKGEESKEESRVETFEKINKEVLANSKAYETLQEATETIGHRLTGSENGAKAEEYTYNLLKSYGFDSVAYQTFEVEAWARDTVALQIDNEPIEGVVSLGHSPVEADVTAEIIDVGNGLRADYEANKEAVEGKIALCYIGLLPGTEDGKSNIHRSEKTALAIEYGAKGIMIINQVKGGVLLTGTASVTGSLIPIPAICITYEDGMELKESLKENTHSATITMKNTSDVIKARNVVATVTGSEKPEEVVLLGGHLDSWDLATGAIDNGIGSFSILDIARTFKALDLQPKRSVQFVMFMGEEQGLLGSKAMVKELKEKEQLDQVKYMMNLDMSGNPVGWNAAGRTKAEGLLKGIGNDIKSVDSTYANKFSNRAGLHSDHQVFMMEGIPTVGAMSNLDRRVYDFYHSNGDDFELVNKEHMVNTVRFGTMLLYGIADADSIPVKKLNFDETGRFFIDQGLKEALELGNEWKWGD